VVGDDGLRIPVARRSAGPAPTRPRLRAFAAVAVVVALVAGGTALRGVRAPAADLLGRLDLSTGASSTTAPPTGVAPRWRTALVAGDDVGRRPPAGVAGAVDAGRRAVVDGDELVVLAATSGRVLSRVTLRGPAGWDPRGAAVAWVDGDPVLVDGAGRHARVGPDGRLVWRAAAGVAVVGHGDGPWTLGRDDTAAGSGRRVVLDALTGAVALRPAADEHAHLVVAGMLVLDDAAGALVGRRLPDGAQVWTSAVQGEPSSRLPVPPPTVLDATAGTLVAYADAPGGAATAHRVRARDGAVLGSVSSWTWATAGDGRQQLDADDDLVVGVAAGRVRARGWDDGRRWEVPVPGVPRDVGVVLRDGEVHVTARAGSEVLRLRPTDGSLLGTLPPPAAAPGLALLAAVDGAVALGAPGPDAPGGVRWLDVRDGRPSGDRSRRPPPSARAGGVPVTGPAGAVTLRAPAGGSPGELLASDGRATTLDVAGGWHAIAGTAAGPVVARTGADGVPELVALDWDGTRRWSRAGPTRPRGVGDAVVAEAAAGGLVVLDGATGAVRWALPAAATGQVLGPLAVDGVSAVVVVGPASVRAHAASSGALLWAAPLGAASAAQAVLLDVRAGGRVVVPTVDGAVVVLDVADGATVARVPLGRVTASTSAGDVAFLAMADGRVVRLGADGAVGQVHVLARRAADLAVVDDHLLVLDAEGLTGIGPVPGGAGRGPVDPPG
jgi:outer membrane protein assembly factor BamB